MSDGFAEILSVDISRYAESMRECEKGCDLAQMTIETIALLRRLGFSEGAAIFERVWNAFEGER